MRQNVALPEEVVAAARLGWRLHPLRPRSKQAILKSWQLLATADLKNLEEWAREYPSCNWGAVAGRESGFFAVDVDDPAAMRLLEDEHGDLPNGLATITARGYALIFRYPEDVEIRPATNRPCPGIDIRGEGSYIAIPPSIHPSGHHYSYSDDSLPIPDCPAWFLGSILTAQGNSRSEVRQEQVLAAPAVIGPGQRTPTLVSLAGKLINLGVPQKGIEEALVAVNQTFVPPHPADKIRHIVTDMSNRYSAGAHSGAALNLHCGTEISDEPVPWILQDHIPDRTVFGIHGRPGEGKTTVAARMAADLSQGKTPFTGDECPPRNIFFLSNEDSPARVRELYVGGNLERLHVENTDDLWWLGDLTRLELAITEHDAGLVVIDSLASHCGKTDLNVHGDSTRLLVPLRALAERRKCAILIIHHLNKTSSPDHLQRVAGSIGISASLRHNLHVVPDPDDPSLRLLVNGKTNLAPPNVPALRFSISPCEPCGTSDITIDEIYSLPAVKNDRGDRRALPWLREALADGEWHKAADILEKAQECRMSERSIFRAADELKLQRQKPIFSGPTYWKLPMPATVIPITTGRIGRIGETKNLSTANSIAAITSESGRLGANRPFGCGGLLDRTDEDGAWPEEGSPTMPPEVLQ
jgi:hypothetical protein